MRLGDGLKVGAKPFPLPSPAFVGEGNPPGGRVLGERMLGGRVVGSKEGLGEGSKPAPPFLRYSGPTSLMCKGRLMAWRMLSSSLIVVVRRLVVVAVVVAAVVIVESVDNNDVAAVVAVAACVVTDAAVVVVVAELSLAKY